MFTFTFSDEGVSKTFILHGPPTKLQLHNSGTDNWAYDQLSVTDAAGNRTTLVNGTRLWLGGDAAEPPGSPPPPDDRIHGITPGGMRRSVYFVFACVCV